MKIHRLNEAVAEFTSRNRMKESRDSSFPLKYELAERSFNDGVSKYISSRCDSPLEETFGECLMRTLWRENWHKDNFVGFSPVSFNVATSNSFGGIELTRSIGWFYRYFLVFFQQSIGRYRPDFVIVERFTDGPAGEEFSSQRLVNPRPIVIECDGWTYHHDRKIKDANRDAVLMEHNMDVLRIAGGRIRNDCQSCVNVLLDWMDLRRAEYINGREEQYHERGCQRFENLNRLMRDHNDRMFGEGEYAPVSDY